MQHCLLSIAVRIHMQRWQWNWTYSLRSALSSFYSSVFWQFSLHYPASTESLFPICGWPWKTECPVQSAIVHLHTNTNGQQLKAINFSEVDPLCAWHQPPWLLSPNTSQSIAATTSILPPQQPWHHLLSPSFSKWFRPHRLHEEHQSHRKEYWWFPEWSC